MTTNMTVYAFSWRRYRAAKRPPGSPPPILYRWGASANRSLRLNRYVPGSTSGVTVSSRDQFGRPSKIVGNYLFDAFNGRSKGSVTVQFSDGLPQCMYFFDFPTTCRSPSRRIITAYENGRYQE